ncbi:MAG TPA: c-type cytochrome [Burkholderiaceae bacterium]|nr:c-type cytochrome [Burkholderiaceae bacterium]
MRLLAIVTVALSALAASSWAGTPAEDLIGSNKCTKCHTSKTTKKGPSFADVAAKYKGQAGAEAKIVEMLKTGGADSHDKVAGSDAELKAIAAAVLATKPAQP